MTILRKINYPVIAPSNSSELREQTRQVIHRIEESTIDAFSSIQFKPASLQSVAMAEMLVMRPLTGLPVAIKEVIDVAGLPIGYGCDAFTDRIPNSSADIVNQLETMGAQVIGVTRSTEMALARETTTCNPWSSSHSPGASSSGSAAAVGAGLVPFALGTQTIGSLIRPAAYCGVVGFKPSNGIGSLSGVLSLSHTLDHLGYFADSLERMTNTISILFPELSSASEADLRLVFVEPWFECQELEHFFVQTDVLKAACTKQGIKWSVRTLPECVTAKENSLVNIILCFELFETWGETLLDHSDVTEELKDFLHFGETITSEEYHEALGLRLNIIKQYHQDSAEGDIVVFPSVVGIPPKLGYGTGSRDPQRLWTLLGLPALNIPIGWDKNFPFNLQLIGRHGADRELLEAGRAVSNLLEQTTLQ